MRYLFIVFLFFFIKQLAFAQPENDCEPIDNKKAEKLVKQARDDIKVRKYLDANNKLKQAIEIEPLYAEAYYLLGLINVKKYDYNVKAAENYLSKAIELCPTVDVYAYYYLGDIYFGAQKYDLAAKCFKEFLKDVDKIKTDKDYNDATEKYNTVSFFDKSLNRPVPFDPKPVRGVSSPLDEYLAIISPDNEMALYTRKIEYKQKTGWESSAKYIERFVFSKRGQDGEFDNGEFMPYPFNQQSNEGGATLTIDNRELFYTVCKMQGNYLNCDIFTSKYEYGEWTDIKSLGTNVNNADTWETQPTVSSDGKTLYFVSDRKDGQGGYDLYKTVRDDKDNWSKAVNLGSPINTAGNERSPFIHTDSQTLYYASGDRQGDDGQYYKAHQTFGGYDIFYTKMNDKGTWEKPKNIGYPINTEADEASFFVSTDGKTAYVASNKIKGGPGGWDLYSFELYPEARPEKVLFIKGEVSQQDKKDVEVEARVELKNAVTKKVTHIPVNKENGQYVAAIKFDSDYILTIKKDDYAYESKYISESDTIYEKPVAIDFEVKPIEKGRSYTINDIYFETDKYDLNDKAKLVIEEFADFMKDHPHISVEIQGHTDNVGNPDYNLFLSDDRARAVYNYIIELGVDKNRVSFKGYGITRPIVTNATEEGRARNRRTEFYIINK